MSMEPETDAVNPEKALVRASRLLVDRVNSMISETGRGSKGFGLATLFSLDEAMGYIVNAVKDIPSWTKM